MDRKTILITGGAGYIGSHAVVAFEEAGYETVVVDNLSNSSIETLGNIEDILGYRIPFFETDLGDRRGLEEVFKRHMFDAVIHFAGLKAVGESCKDPFLYFENNVAGSMVLFEMMRKYSVSDIVFSSSATVHDPKYAPSFREDTPTGTTNPYGTSKLIIEQLLRDLSKYADWRSVALRYFNPIGAHPSGMIGEKPNTVPNNLLPYVFEVALGKRDVLGVFGDDYPTRDGTGVRDYIDVNDLVHAHVLALRRLLGASLPNPFMVVNLGSGKGTSVLEMIDAVGKTIGIEIPYRVLPRRSGDIAEFYTDSDLAKSLLGWVSKTSLEESIASGWNFVKKNSS